MIYLASPYSHPDKDVVADRVLQTQRLAVKLWTEYRRIIFSPVMHWHHAAIDQDLPTDAASWQDYNNKMILLCEVVCVVTLDGWEDSKGVAAEIAFAKGTGVA